MALVLADRVQQTGTANTVVSFTLSASVPGFQTFAVVGDGNTTYYTATDASGNWEVGIGSYVAAGPTLDRITILSSSNSGIPVTFSGTVNVWVDYPSEQAVFASNNPGVAGYVLTTNGCCVAPSWQPGGSPAATPTTLGTVFGQTTVTCGQTKLGHNVSGCGVFGTGIGANANAQEFLGTAIGINASANGFGQGVAIGSYSRTCGFVCSGVAVGAGSLVSGSYGSIAIGNDSTSTSGGIALGPFVTASQAGFYASPVRSTCCAGGTPVALGYCVGTKEIIYGVGGGSSSSINCGFTSVNTIQTTAPTRITFVLGGTNSGHIIASGYPGGYSTALGYSAGAICQSSDTVAIGSYSGHQCQGFFATAIGDHAGYMNQAFFATAVGHYSGYQCQNSYTVAIGVDSGYSRQGGQSVAVGFYSGNCSQGNNSVAIGSCAGAISQGNNALAIGFSAGFSSQASCSIVIGANANAQEFLGTAIGINASANGSSSGSIAIGAFTYASNGSIAIGVGLCGCGPGLFIKPVRYCSGAPTCSSFSRIYYNSASGEFVYA